jgi:hypothetical protein
MIKLLRTLIAALPLLCFCASSQTITYTVPAGDTCTATLNGCTIHDLTTTDPTITPWGYFVGGVYYTQFAFQLFRGQNAAAGGTYCPGTGTYTLVPRPDLSPTSVEWQLDCTSTVWTNGSGAGEVPSGPYHIVVDIIAHWYQRLVRGYKTPPRLVTFWDTDGGAVALTPISQ